MRKRKPELVIDLVTPGLGGPAASNHSITKCFPDVAKELAQCLIEELCQSKLIHELVEHSNGKQEGDPPSQQDESSKMQTMETHFEGTGNSHTTSALNATVHKKVFFEAKTDPLICLMWKDIVCVPLFCIARHDNF